MYNYFVNKIIFAIRNYVDVTDLTTDELPNMESDDSELDDLPVVPLTSKVYNYGVILSGLSVGP